MLGLGSKQGIGALALSVMATVIAIFGQNSFIGVFTEDFMKQLDLTYSRFGLILMLSTLLASVIVQQTSQWLERLGTYKTSVLVVIGGVVSLLLFGLVPSLSQSKAPLAAVMSLALGMTGFRFIFRGSFRMLSSSIVTQIFNEKQRGKAFALTGVLSALIGSTLPYIAHQFQGSAERVQLIGFMIAGLLFFGICAFALRSHFDAAAPKPTEARGSDDTMQETTLMEARNQPIFWLYLFGVPLYSLLLSSAILFLDAVSTSSGVPYAKGLSFNIGAALVGIPFFVWASINMKRSGLVFIMYLGSIALSFAGFLNFASLAGQIMAFSGFGMSSAFYTALSMNLWPTLFGRKHATQFFGFSASFDLMATAIGPMLFGLGMEYFSIPVVLRIALYVPLALGVLFILASQLPTPDGSVAVVCYRGSFWQRWLLLFSKAQPAGFKRHHILAASTTAYWKKSFRYFPNHHFQQLLWNLLNRADQGQKATLLVFEPRSQSDKFLSIAVHEVLALHGDKFLAFQAIGEVVRNLYYSVHKNEELVGLDSTYHNIPKFILRDEILQSDEVQRSIQEQKAQGDGSAARKAENYFKEIVCDRHYFVAKALNAALTFAFRRIFTSLELQGVDRLRELNRRYQVVYLPSHRSHLDFLTLSYKLHNEGIEAPFIAASNHLNFFPVRYVRMVSAYFIRRKKMDSIYNAVLYQYIKSMQRYGKPNMVFVEGTRSKTGEVLQPKAGIVSQYLNAYIEEQARPVVFVPMNITYDFVLEGDSYLEQILEFRKKFGAWNDEDAKAYAQHVTDRSKRGLLVKLSRLLKGIISMKPKGNAYLTPGEPIFLNEVLEAQCPNWKSQAVIRQDAIPDPWIREIAYGIARRACMEINRVSPLTPGALVSTALLASRGHALSESDLRAYVALTTDLWQRAYGTDVKINNEKLEEILASIPFVNKCRRRSDRRGSGATSTAMESRRGDRRQAQKIFLAPLDSLRSTYSRNNVIHSFVIPHLLALQLMNSSMLLRVEMLETFASSYEPLRQKYQLPWDVTDAWMKLEQFIQMFEERGLLSQSHEAIMVNRNEMANSILGLYAKVLISA